MRTSSYVHLKIPLQDHGEGVKNGWGLSKKIYHHLPITTKSNLDVFIKSIKDCGLQVTSPERARRLSTRFRKYMLWLTSKRLSRRLIAKVLQLYHLDGLKCSLTPALL
jgi:hypothetical protein